MSPSGALPLLDLADFGPGQDHQVASFVGGKVVAITHRLDPSLAILPGLTFPPTDPYIYVFVHGGGEHTRFENLATGTHEIPVDVVASILFGQFGPALAGMKVRLCSCYGNLLRPGDTMTLAQRLAVALPSVQLEAYHALVVLTASPSRMRFGVSVRWDPTLIPPGPLVTGPPGNWEPV